MRLAIVALCLALGACSTAPKPPVDVPPVAEPCPAEGSAALQPGPTHPVTDAAAMIDVYRAITQVLGPELAERLVRFWETELPVHDALGWERVGRVKAWCDAR